MNLKKQLLFTGLCLCLLSQTALAATLYPNRTDFRDEQIYFVMTTRFYDGDPDNNTQCWDGQNYNAGDPAWRGDFKGLIEKLDYIKALGFTAIWITPVVENASGYDYHGYHASDMSKVDHRYESDDVSFQSLIDAAHSKGMKVILDIVLNHTGNFGEANLCKLFERDWTADQSSIDDCMVPYTVSQGGQLPDNYLSLQGKDQYSARLSKMKNTTGVNYDVHNHWHHYGTFNWDEPNRWFAQIAGDCVDLNTENPAVYNYLIRCYTSFIAMGVDGFRIDTGGHIPRLTFNKAFIPAFAAAGKQYKDKRGGTPFYMFAEVCARFSDITYRGQPALSCYYYTWKETTDRAWDTNAASWDNIVAMEGDKCEQHTNHKSVWATATDNSMPTSANAILQNNTYRQPDYSRHSGLNVIDFPVHHNFKDLSTAWGVAKEENDKYYNDATWNVVYVDSHDYAPNGAPEDQRFAQSQDTWAENLSAMYTFRGIPCVYYGSEIEFKKGCPIDKGPTIALRESGRAYFGGYIKGTAKVTDFAEYTGATGNMAQTLSHPLAQHIQRLSKIRMAIPALRKGQYTKSGCSGQFAFKRRYTDASVDSYALVTISGNATFSNIPNGTYVDAVTGDTKTVTNGSLTATCSGKGNMRVYVLSTEKTPAPGKIGTDGKYLYTSKAASIPAPKWDGTQEELTDDAGSGGDSEEETTPPCLFSADERAVFFTAPEGYGNNINAYIWIDDNGVTKVCGEWPGKRATALGDRKYKFVLPEDAPAVTDKWMIIFNDGQGKQTADCKFLLHGMYNGQGTTAVETISLLCEDIPSAVENTPSADLIMYSEQGTLYIRSSTDQQVSIYAADGRRITQMHLQTGMNSIALPQGLYLVGHQKAVVY